MNTREAVVYNSLMADYCRPFHSTPLSIVEHDGCAAGSWVEEILRGQELGRTTCALSLFDVGSAGLLSLTFRRRWMRVLCLYRQFVGPDTTLLHVSGKGLVADR